MRVLELWREPCYRVTYIIVLAFLGNYFFGLTLYLFWPHRTLRGFYFSFGLTRKFSRECISFGLTTARDNVRANQRAVGPFLSLSELSKLSFNFLQWTPLYSKFLSTLNTSRQ